MLFKVNHFPSQQKPDSVRPVYTPLEYLPSIRYNTMSRYSMTRCVRTKHVLHPNKFVPQSFENTRSKKYHETVSRRILKTSNSDQFHVVDNITQNRLDVIAQKYYNNPRLWWILADANPQVRFNPYNIPRGTTIRIPCVDTLYESGGVLDA